MRSIKNIHGDKEPHWVGDGFYVKTLVNHLEKNPEFNYQHTDPFLLLDYSQPVSFAPNPNFKSQPHGVGQHPHKGFETVTIAYAGEISHADSTGGYGVIEEGDVQWMTAGRGIMHEEFHSEAFGQRGGDFSMVQLWVNLPSAHKLTDPKYQSIKRADLPVLELKDNKTGNIIGTAVIIAGEWQDTEQSQNSNRSEITQRTTHGAADTFSAINMWNIELHASGTATLQVPSTHNAMLLVQEGRLLINGTPINAGNLIQFADPDVNRTAADSDSIELEYSTATNADEPLISVKLLLLSGEPIGEPIAGYGPFVMNTQAELKQTFRDYQTGNFGK